MWILKKNVLMLNPALLKFNLFIYNNFFIYSYNLIIDKMKQFKNHQNNEKIINVNTIQINNENNQIKTKDIMIPNINNYDNFISEFERYKKIEIFLYSDVHNNIDIPGGRPQLQQTMLKSNAGNRRIPLFSRMSGKKERKELRNNLDYKKQYSNCDGKRELDRKLDDIKLRKARLLKQMSIDAPHLWTALPN